MLFRLAADGRGLRKAGDMEIPITALQIAQWYEGVHLHVVAPHLTDAEHEFIMSGAMPVELTDIIEAMQNVRMTSVTLGSLYPGRVFTMVGDTIEYMFLDRRGDSTIRVVNHNFEIQDRLACEMVRLLEAPCVNNPQPTHESGTGSGGQATTGNGSTRQGASKP